MAYAIRIAKPSPMIRNETIILVESTAMIFSYVANIKIRRGGHFVG